jgi:hypothetical protein
VTEHCCPWCHKTYPCPDPPGEKGCKAERRFMCRDCALNPPSIENYRSEFAVLRTDEVQERLTREEE